MQSVGRLPQRAPDGTPVHDERHRPAQTTLNQLAAHPKLVTLVLQVVHRVITRHLLGQAGLKAKEADSGTVILIQRFGSAANLMVQPQYPRCASH